MKTAISILQEMMTKMGEQAQFEVVYQGGPPHQMLFKYQCTAAGVSVIASGRSKKDAKQDAAQMCLDKMAELGMYKPPPTRGTPFAPPSPQRTVPAPPDATGVNINSYVALMKEFCEEYHLPAPVYELVSDAGPPHCRVFEVQVTVGAHTRSGIANTKKVARQIAAQKIYMYLRENLSKITRDFNEGEAIVKANLKAQEKYLEVREETQPWRPNLGQKVSEHHLGLKNNTDKTQQADALEIINNIISTDNLVDKVEEVLQALDLEFEWLLLPSYEKYATVVLLDVPRAHPSFTIASPPAGEAEGKQATAKQALEYIKTMLL